MDLNHRHGASAPDSASNAASIAAPESAADSNSDVDHGDVDDFDSDSEYDSAVEYDAVCEYDSDVDPDYDSGIGSESDSEDDTVTDSDSENDIGANSDSDNSDESINTAMRTNDDNKIPESTWNKLLEAYAVRRFWKLTYVGWYFICLMSPFISRGLMLLFSIVIAEIDWETTRFIFSISSHFTH
jgi:hypothetical protein